MWSVVERKVNKRPHNILVSLKAKILDVMTNIDREIVILSSSVEPTPMSIMLSRKAVIDSVKGLFLRKEVPLQSLVRSSTTISLNILILSLNFPNSLKFQAT